jgi:hypothetical protein
MHQLDLNVWLRHPAFLANAATAICLVAAVVPRAPRKRVGSIRWPVSPEMTNFSLPTTFPRGKEAAYEVVERHSAHEFCSTARN